MRIQTSQSHDLLSQDNIKYFVIKRIPVWTRPQHTVFNTWQETTNEEVKYVCCLGRRLLFGETILTARNVTEIVMQINKNKAGSYIYLLVIF